MHALELFKVIIILESIFEQLSKLDIGKVKKYNDENTIFDTKRSI